jgi:Tol biopolymer transport system component
MQLLAAALLISGVAACGPKTTATPAEIELATEATEAPISPSLPTETPPVPDAVLPTDDSWWVIAAEDGIYAVKPDGSGLKKLSNQTIYPIMMGPFVEGAPSGGHLAFSELSNVSDDLYLLSLSSGETKVVASLTSAIGQVTQGHQFFEATTYVVSSEGAAWSPDGRNLAFVGLIDGPTMDLYVYSVDDGSITRLTDGNTPTLRPIWSPDGMYISHHGVPGLPLGDGPDVASLWVAQADGSEDRKILDGGEMAIGWMDSENLIVRSNDFGYVNLRIINVETGSEEVLWKDYFSDVALDAETGTLLLGVNQYAAEKNPDVRQGLYLIPVGGAPTWRIVEDEPKEVVWSDEAGLFFAKTGGSGILAVSLTADFIDLDVPASSNGFPLVAPGTWELAWTGSELWVGTLSSGLDNPSRQIFPEPVFQATWGPQGQYLLFISAGRLYVARSPEFSPVLVGEGLNADITAWVLP